MSDHPRFTVLGKFISILLVAGLVTLGVYLIQRGGNDGEGGGDRSPRQSESAPEIAPVQVAVPTLSPPAPFTLRDNIVPIEISEYAGYAGLIVANGGLEPNENSYFFKN